jgi:aldose 1-epimerase
VNDIVELIAGNASMRIAPAMGCAIAAFILGEQPVLRPTTREALATANVRLAGCYPLVPYSNRIRDAELHFGGKRYVLERNFGTHPHAIHGIGWQRSWHVDAASSTRARMTLEHDASGADAAAWPWPFRVTQTFELASLGKNQATLVVTLTLESRAAEAFPFGLGWHPFFPKSATTQLTFSANGVWENDSTQLPVRHIPVPLAWQFQRAKALDDLVLDNVFTQWRGHVKLVAASGMNTAIDADTACRDLVVYSPSGADFIALEPVTHETDAFNRAEAGATDTGFRTLPPHASFSCTMRIAASLAR